MIRPPADIPRLPAVPDYVRPSAAAARAGSSDVARSIRIEPLKHYFKLSLPRIGVSIPAQASGKVMQSDLVKDIIFAARNIRPVISDPMDPSRKRIVILNAEKEEQLSAELKELFASLGGELVPYNVQLDYDYFMADQVLASLLPQEHAKGTPTSFTIIGHIAHLNLRDEYLPYRYLIGDVILDKNSRAVRTVVNKLDTIDAEFRFFDMELLAGVPEFETVASEQHCSFTFDFRTVYFNSRLHAEHARIAQLEFNSADVVVDVMAGVGPFAIPAAKNERGSRANRIAAAHAVSGGPSAPAVRSKPAEAVENDESAGPCWVLANDLNPASTESLAYNVVKNKVSDRVFVATRGRVKAQNAKGKQRYIDDDIALLGENDQPLGLDGREFIRRATRWVWDGGVWPKPSKPRPAPRTAPGTTPDTIGRALFEAAPPSRRRVVPKEVKPPARIPQHYVMNLPGSAIEFLDAYRGLFTRIFDGAGEREAVSRLLSRGEEGADRKLRYPMVHVHCFTKALEAPYEDIVARANRALGFEKGAEEGGIQVPAYHERPVVPASLMLSRNASKAEDSEADAGDDAEGVAREGAEHVPPMSSIAPVTGDSVPCSEEDVGRGREVKIHFVRRVSPNKDMYCLSFRLWAECVWS